MIRVGVFSPLPQIGPPDHVRMLRAFGEGVARAGDTAVGLFDIAHGYVECDVAVVFGVVKRAVGTSWPRGRIFFEHRVARGRPIVVLERGYVRRDEYFCAGWNGLNGSADHRIDPERAPSDRWRALGVELKPFRAADPDPLFVVCGQVPWDATVQDHDNVAWCQETVKALTTKGCRVTFRPHPQVADKVDYGVPAELVSKRTWEEDLRAAGAVLTFNSTTAAGALIDGVPVYVAHPGSIAWEAASMVQNLTASRDPYETFLRADWWSPDREAERDRWANALAYRQWTEAEMRTGEAWDFLARYGIEDLHLPFAQRIAP